MVYVSNTSCQLKIHAGILCLLNNRRSRRRPLQFQHSKFLINP